MLQVASLLSMMMLWTGKRLGMYFKLKAITPRSDEHTTSPYNVHTLFSKQVMRIFKLVS